MQFFSTGYIENKESVDHNITNAFTKLSVCRIVTPSILIWNLVFGAKTLSKSAYFPTPHNIRGWRMFLLKYNNGLSLKKIWNHQYCRATLYFNKGIKNFKNVPSQGNSCYSMLKQIFEWPLNTPEFGLFQRINCTNSVTH